MKTLDEFRARHAKIRSVMQELKPLLSTEKLSVMPNATMAYKLLCELSCMLKEHLNDEDKGLYPPLLIHDDPKVKSLAWGFISGERPLRRMFNDYHNRWTKDCEFRFNEVLLDETNQLLRMVTERMDREEHFLFPKLEELGMQFGKMPKQRPAFRDTL